MERLLDGLVGFGALAASAVACAATIGLTFVSRIETRRRRKAYAIGCVLVALAANIVQGYVNFHSGVQVSALSKQIFEEQRTRRVSMPTTVERCAIRDAIFRLLRANGLWPRNYGEYPNGDIEFLYASSEVRPDDGIICIPSYDVDKIGGGDDKTPVDSRLSRYLFSEKPFAAYPSENNEPTHARFCEYVCYIATAISHESVSWNAPDGIPILYLTFHDSNCNIDLDSRECRALQNLTRMELMQRMAEILMRNNLNPEKYLTNGD